MMTADAIREAMRQMTAMVSASPPAIGRIICNERMMPEARLVAPPEGQAYLGLPISINNSVPDGHLILMDRFGKIIGMVGPEKPK